MSNFDKLIDAIVKKNGSCDSSTLNGCSVRVNDNPLYADCVVDGRLVSDLELALVDKNQSVLDYLERTLRAPKFADSGSRHVSIAELFNSISQMDDALDSMRSQPSAPAPDSQPSAPAPDSQPSAPAVAG